MISVKKIFLWLFLLGIGLALPAIATAQSNDESAVVRAVLFYSPSCPHCHYVIQEVIIPMTEEHGDQLQVLGIDTSQPTGSHFYQVAIEQFQIPPQRQGVPTLVIGDVVLVGSGEIPEQFPGLVKEHLAAGGLDWPDIPELVESIAAAEAQAETTTASSPEPQPSEETRPEPATPTTASTEEAQEQAAAPATAAPLPTDTPIAVAEQSVQSISKDTQPVIAETQTEPPPDPVGTALAATILVFMATSLVFAIWRIVNNLPLLAQLERAPIPQLKPWLIPLLSLVGLGVATYLAYVEITHVKAVCGPIGECNIVQASPYAQLLGIPIAVLGMLSYITIILLWVVQKYATRQLANLSILALLTLTCWGVIFSIYLTWLEIFTIRAVCAWCLTSAVISTLLMLVVAIPVTAWPQRLQQPGMSSIG